MISLVLILSPFQETESTTSSECELQIQKSFIYSYYCSIVNISQSEEHCRNERSFWIKKYDHEKCFYAIKVQISATGLKWLLSYLNEVQLIGWSLYFCGVRDVRHIFFQAASLNSFEKKYISNCIFHGIFREFWKMPNIRSNTNFTTSNLNIKQLLSWY